MVKVIKFIPIQGSRYMYNYLIKVLTMFTKEIVEELSEFLSIEFKCPDYPVKLSCIFNENNSSYIDYDYTTKRYQFLLVYDKQISFSFDLESLDHKSIYEAMKKYNEEMHQLEINKVNNRKRIYHDLKKKI
jgi:hypothetical protein